MSNFVLVPEPFIDTSGNVSAHWDSHTWGKQSCCRNDFFAGL